MNTSIIQGESLLKEIPSGITPGVPYTPPELFIALYADYAKTHKTALIPFSSMFVPATLNERCEHVIFLNSATMRALVAKAIEFGSDYNPQTWNTESPYQIPDGFPAAPTGCWVAVEQVRETVIDIEAYNKIRYRRVGKELVEVTPLSREFMSAHSSHTEMIIAPRA